MERRWVSSAVCRREVELNFNCLLLTEWSNVHGAVAPTAEGTVITIVYVLSITIPFGKDIKQT